MKTLPQIRLELKQLHDPVLEGQQAMLKEWHAILPQGDGSSSDAVNLAVYVAFRRLKLRKLQDTLRALGSAACAPAGEGACVGRVPCAQPEVPDSLQPGERVFLGDGYITAEVEQADEAGAWLGILRAAPEGDKIRSNDGPNFPGGELALPLLTEKGLQDLDFVASESGLVDYSFLRDVEQGALRAGCHYHA